MDSRIEQAVERVLSGRGTASKAVGQRIVVAQSPLLLEDEAVFYALNQVARHFDAVLLLSVLNDLPPLPTIRGVSTSDDLKVLTESWEEVHKVQLTRELQDLATCYRHISIEKRVEIQVKVVRSESVESTIVAEAAAFGAKVLVVGCTKKNSRKLSRTAKFCHRNPPPNCEVHILTKCINRAGEGRSKHGESCRAKVGAFLGQALGSVVGERSQRVQENGLSSDSREMLQQRPSVLIEKKHENGGIEVGMGKRSDTVGAARWLPRISTLNMIRRTKSDDVSKLLQAVKDGNEQEEGHRSLRVVWEEGQRGDEPERTRSKSSGQPEKVKTGGDVQVEHESEDKLYKGEDGMKNAAFGEEDEVLDSVGEMASYPAWMDGRIDDVSGDLSAMSSTPSRPIQTVKGRHGHRFSLIVAKDPLKADKSRKSSEATGSPAWSQKDAFKDTSELLNQVARVTRIQRPDLIGNGGCGWDDSAFKWQEGAGNQLPTPSAKSAKSRWKTAKLAVITVGAVRMALQQKVSPYCRPWQVHQEVEGQKCPLLLEEIMGIPHELPFLSPWSMSENESPSNISSPATSMSHVFRSLSADGTESSISHDTFTRSATSQGFTSADAASNSPRVLRPSHSSPSPPSLPNADAVLNASTQRWWLRASSSPGINSLLAGSLGPQSFTLGELALASDSFSDRNLIGEGGFSKVYKGQLEDGQKVAVKLLRRSKHMLKELLSEMNVMMRMEHPNVVHLTGFCIDRTSSCLVYELMPHGSLLSCLQQKVPLTWPRRVRIAMGIGRGLHYIHHECMPRIIHRDIKSANILIGHGYIPKVADFGLAKWSECESDEEEGVRGTMGYMSPEYALYGEMSEKSDVYAFGVVLLEIITGRRVIDVSYEPEETHLTTWALSKLSQCCVEDIVDPRLEGQYKKDSLWRMAVAAMACLRNRPELRPRPHVVTQFIQSDAFTATKLASIWNDLLDLPDAESREQNELLRSASQKQRVLALNLSS